MSEAKKVRPVNQKIRINILRLLFICLLPMILFVEPAYDEPSFIVELFEASGGLLIVAGVLGRFWSILYIGGLKNAGVMQIGPYSLCRHPLYLFSTVAVLGFGLMMGSLIVATVLAGSTLLVLSMTARREERFLRAEFGGDYDAYAAKVPMILPRPSGFHTPRDVMFRTDVLRTNFIDALVFLAFIPMAELLEFVKEIHALPTIGIY